MNKMMASTTNKIKKMDIKIKKPNRLIGCSILMVLMVFSVPCDGRQSQTSKPFFETPPHTVNHKQAAGKIHLTESVTTWLKAHPDIQLGYNDAFEPKVIVNTDGTGFIPLREFAGGVDYGRKPNHSYDNRINQET